MHLRSLPLLSLFCAALPICSAAPSPKMLVISISGFDSRFLENADRVRLKIPNLSKLMTRSASASLLADVGSSEKNETMNHGGLRGAALWQEATSAHLRTGLVFWPDSVGALTAFNFPAYWEPQAGFAIPFDPVASRSTPPGITQKVEKMFPSFEKQIWDDSSSAYAALYLLSKENPDVLFVHMADLDTEQHETAALSVYAREILEIGDDWIGQMLAKVSPGTTVAIVSDHGFQNENYLVRPKVMLQTAKVNGKTTVAMGLIGAEDKAAAEHLRKLIGNRKYGIAREVPMAEVRTLAPELGTWTAAFDTFPDYVASAQTKGPMLGPGSHHGVHSFWPTHKDFRSVFLIAGEGIRPKKLGEIHAVDIAPTLADAIRVKLPSAKSKSLWQTLLR